MNEDKRKQWRVTTEQVGGFPVAWRTDYALPPSWRTTLDGAHAPYLIELEFVADENGPSCRAIRLAVREGGETMSASRVRYVPVGECIEVAVSAAAMRVERRPGEIAFALGPSDPTDRMELAREVRPRAANTSDEHLREVAKVYEAATEKPTRAVEDAFGPISHSTAARWVMEARRRGFLPPTTRGRSSARRGQNP